MSLAERLLKLLEATDLLVRSVRDSLGETKRLATEIRHLTVRRNNQEEIRKWEHRVGHRLRFMSEKAKRVTQLVADLERDFAALHDS